MLVDLGRNDVGKVIKPHHGQPLNALPLAVFQVLLSWSMCTLAYGRAHSLLWLTADHGAALCSPLMLQRAEGDLMSLTDTGHAQCACAGV